jgi:hypothetical protein
LLLLLVFLQGYQTQDFEGIFRAMDGKPVTIRLLDPPLHEFLPQEVRLERFFLFCCAWFVLKADSVGLLGCRQCCSDIQPGLAVQMLMGSPQNIVTKASKGIRNQLNVCVNVCLLAVGSCPEEAVRAAGQGAGQ